MGFFYFDESVHSRGDFTLGAFAYSETSLDQHVAEALDQSGLNPYEDEFKSGSLMARHPEQAHARSLLKSIARKHCRVGIVTAPASPNTLGLEAMLGLSKIVSTNSFRSPSHDVFFDEGIFTASDDSRRLASQFCSAQNCRFHLEQRSDKILGLQVADLIAHTCATMLLARIGLVKKTIKAGPDSGYEADSDIPLEYELWASLRNNFFAAAPPPFDSWKSQLDFTVDVASRGLHISQGCDGALREAALLEFGSMYLGCIH
jgi:hypothetical protein